MSIVKRLIEKRVTYLMQKIEEICVDFEDETGGSAIENANAALRNKEMFKKLTPLQLELKILDMV